MIYLTRLNRQNIVLNADLIKWIESSPDTVITLLTGEKLIVMESCQAIIEAVVSFRQRVGWSEPGRHEDVRLPASEETD